MFESVCQCAEGLEWAAGCDTEQAKQGKWAGRNHFFPILRHFYAANCEQHWPVPPASGLCWCTWTTHCEPEPGAPNLEHKNTSHVWQLKREFWGQIKQQDKSQRRHAWETAAALRAPPSHFLFRGGATLPKSFFKTSTTRAGSPVSWPWNRARSPSKTLANREVFMGLDLQFKYMCIRSLTISKASLLSFRATCPSGPIGRYLQKPQPAAQPPDISLSSSSPSTNIPLQEKTSRRCFSTRRPFPSGVNFLILQTSTHCPTLGGHVLLPESLSAWLYPLVFFLSSSQYNLNRCIHT